MKKIIIFTFLCWANAAFGQSITAIATGYVAGASVQSVSTSTTLNISSGQLIHVTCTESNGGNPGTITVTDTGTTNTFTASPDGPVTIGGNVVETFYAQNTVAKSSDTITCNYVSFTSYVSVLAIQMSGMATTSVLDTHAMGTGTGTTLTSGAFTTTAANDIVIAGAGWNNIGITCTAGTNFTLQNTPAEKDACDESWIPSTTQSGVTATMTIGSSNSWMISVMAYKKAASVTSISRHKRGMWR